MDRRRRSCREPTGAGGELSFDGDGNDDDGDKDDGDDLIVNV